MARGQKADFGVSFPPPTASLMLPAASQDIVVFTVANDDEGYLTLMMSKPLFK